MTDALRSEWLKFRTVRGNIVLIICAIGAPLLLSILIAIFGDFDQNDSQDVFEAIVLVPTFICVFLAAVLGILGIGQEYRHNTIRVTFTTQPLRSRVLAAKATVTGLFGLYIGLFTPLLCFGISGLILKARDYDVSLTDPQLNLISLLGLALLCALVSLMGFGFCCILRQPAAAIPIFLVWALVAEGIVGAIVDQVAEGASKWLPFQAGFRIALSDVEGTEVLSRPVAIVYFSLWTALVVVIGWWMAERRDA